MYFNFSNGLYLVIGLSHYQFGFAMKTDASILTQREIQRINQAKRLLQNRHPSLFHQAFEFALMPSQPTTFEVRNLLEHATQTWGSFKFRFRCKEASLETEKEREKIGRGKTVAADEWKTADKIRK